MRFRAGGGCCPQCSRRILPPCSWRITIDRVEAEDNAHVVLDFGEAVFGVVSTGFTMQQYRSPCLEVYGSRHTLMIDGAAYSGATGNAITSASSPLSTVCTEYGTRREPVLD